MRIGILTHNYPQNIADRIGAGRFIYDFAHRIRDFGHEVFVFCPGFNGEKKEDKKVPVTWFKWLGGGKKLGSMSFTNPISFVEIISLYLNGTRNVIKFVEKNKIEFCLAIWAFPSGIFAVRAKSQLGIPVGILTFGSDIFVYSSNLFIRPIIVNILKKSDILLGNSKKICDAVCVMTNKQSIFIPMMSALSFNGFVKKRLDKKNFVFLYTGRIEKVKGLDLLVEAARKISKKCKGFRIYIVGEGTQRHDLELRVSKYGLKKYIKFTGNISDNKKLAAMYLGSDCFVIPSRSESMSFSALEGIHAGLPLIATNVGDMGEVVRKNGLGYSIDPERPDLLAKSMIKAIKEGRSFKKKREKNLKKVKKQYSLDNTVRIFLELIQRY